MPYVEERIEPNRFREDSIKDGWSDWQLAHLAVDIRRMERYGGTLKAGVEPRLRKEFTADEILRIDAYLAVSLPDTGRLTQIEDRLESTAEEDITWLTDQLRTAWNRLEKLRDRIDNGGSLIDNGRRQRHRLRPWNPRDGMNSRHPHPLSPAELPENDKWFRGCPDCYLPIQGGDAGLATHRRTVHSSAGDPRTPITIRLDH